MQIFNVYLVYTPSTYSGQIWDHIGTALTREGAVKIALRECETDPIDSELIDENDCEFEGTTIVSTDIEP